MVTVEGVESGTGLGEMESVESFFVGGARMASFVVEG